MQDIFKVWAKPKLMPPGPEGLGGKVPVFHWHLCHQTPGLVGDDLPMTEEEASFLDVDIEIEDVQEDLPLDEESKGKPSKFLTVDVFLDTEFNNNKGLSIQLIVKTEINGVMLRQVYFVVDLEFEEQITQEIMVEHPDVIFLFRNLDTNKRKNYILELLYEFFKSNSIDIENFKTIKVYLWFYYSLKDLNIGFGPENMRDQYLKIPPTIKQFRSVCGYLVFEDKLKFILKDLFGMEKYGLLQLVTSYGLDPGEKESLLEYKTCMERAFVEKTSTFVAYSLNDVYVLEQLPQTIVNCYNVAVMSDSFGLPESEYFTVYTIPLTIGSLVNSILLKYIRYVVFKNDPAIQLTF